VQRGEASRGLALCVRRLAHGSASGQDLGIDAADVEQRLRAEDPDLETTAREAMFEGDTEDSDNMEPLD